MSQQPAPEARNEDVLRFPHPVLPAKQLGQDLKKVTVMNRSYVLFRDASGKPVAVRGACPHRGAPLAKGRLNAQRELVCPYHAWRINAEGQVKSPSIKNLKCKVPVLKTWERHGFIWIANPDVPDDALPEVAREGYEFAGAFQQDWDAGPAAIMDNFSEIEHAYQVHKLIGPDRQGIGDVEFKVDVHEDYTAAQSACRYRSMPALIRFFFGIKKGDYYHNDWTFRFRPLQGSYLNYWTDPEGRKRRPISFVINSFIVPVDDKRTRMPVFVQVRIESAFLRLFAPIIRKCALWITRLEIKHDADVAEFAPEHPEDGQKWLLTRLDRQIKPNRERMERIYFGPAASGLKATSQPDNSQRKARPCASRAACPRSATCGRHRPRVQPTAAGG